MTVSHTGGDCDDQICRCRRTIFVPSKASFFFDRVHSVTDCCYTSGIFYIWAFHESWLSERLLHPAYRFSKKSGTSQYLFGFSSILFSWRPCWC